MPITQRYPTYMPAIDWNDDGTFGNSAEEDLRGRTLSDPAPETEIGRDQATSIGGPMAGRMSMTLYNTDGALDRDNSGSPIYGLVRTNRPARFTAGIGDPIPYRSHYLYREPDTPYRGQAQVPFFQGRVENYEFEDKDGLKTVKVTALGRLAELQAIDNLVVPVLTNVTTDVAVAAVLDACGVLPSERVLSTGYTTLAYWWADNTNALGALKQILATEGPGAALYEDGQGRIHFEDRHYRDNTARCLTPQHVYDTGINVLSINVDPRSDAIINRATATASRRQLQAAAVVWSLGQTLTLTSSQVRRITVRPQDPFRNAVAPVAGTDYTVSSGSATVTLVGTGGAASQLIITAGVGGATVTGLQLRAESFVKLDEIDVESEPPNPESTNDFGDKVKSLGNWPEVDFNVLKDLCDEMVLRYQFERPLFTITAFPRDFDELRQIMAHQISDRIEISDNRSGITVHVWIEQLKHQPASGGRMHLVTIVGEFAWGGAGGGVGGPVSRWDTDTWGAARWSS